MRLKTWKTVSLIVIGSNMLALFYMLSRLDPNKCKCTPELTDSMPELYKSVEQEGQSDWSIGESELKLLNNATYWALKVGELTAKVSSSITIVIREFETFENDLKNTLNSILTILPNVSVLIVSDTKPYPPLDYPQSVSNRVRLINLKLDPQQSYAGSSVDIKTTHVMLVPDSTRFESLKQLLKLMSRLSMYKTSHMIASKVIGGKSKGLDVRLDLRKWALNYEKSVKAQSEAYDVLEGDHVVFLETSLFSSVSYPFARPFPNAMFIQTALKRKKVRIMDDLVFESGDPPLFLDPHNRWKKDNLNSYRLQLFYQDFGIKKVSLSTGVEQLYGCTKETQRCFGTVIDDTPEYLFQNRWTPPCCLEHLRETSRYVFGILEKCGVRYWLEGGSLLGAVRYEDIIPWDYDVDIGIYKEDIQKCTWLKNAEKQTIIDSNGFVWEKAKEGDFLRVQYSKTNHLHIDIFPFYSKDNVMTKDTWFLSHKQDTEFPEHFLKPFSRIKFIGMYVSAPNNIREFIELKFGKGAIEKPEYPAPHKLSLNTTI